MSEPPAMSASVLLLLVSAKLMNRFWCCWTLSESTLYTLYRAVLYHYSLYEICLSIYENVHRKLKRFSDSWNESRCRFYHKRLSELYSFFYISYFVCSNASVLDNNVEHCPELKTFSEKSKNIATPCRGYSADKKTFAFTKAEYMCTAHRDRIVCSAIWRQSTGT
jgi:hypothetical protein